MKRGGNGEGRRRRRRDEKEVGGKGTDPLERIHRCRDA